jgi:hypothetical protein
MGEPAVRRWGTKGRWGIWAFECKRLDGQSSWHLRAGSLTLEKALSRLEVLNRNARPQLAVPLLSAPSAESSTRMLSRDPRALGMEQQQCTVRDAITAHSHRGSLLCLLIHVCSGTQSMCEHPEPEMGLWLSILSIWYKQPDFRSHVPWAHQPKHAGLGSGYDDSAGAASDDPHLKKKRSWQGSRHRLEMAVTQRQPSSIDRLSQGWFAHRGVTPPVARLQVDVQLC